MNRNKKERLRQQLAVFVKQYGRKAQKGRVEPNDRSYDRRLQKLTRKLNPEDLNELLNE